MQRRNTKQKQIILNEVQSRCDHPTADQIYESVRNIDKNISKGTVYRNLAVLSEENQIKSIELPEMNHYDLKTGNHNHFVCRKCGKVFDIDIKYDNSFDNTSFEDFQIDNHETVFKGLCPDCRNFNTNNNTEENV